MICGGRVLLIVYRCICAAKRNAYFGAGHIAVILSKFVKILGFQVTIIDDRADIY